MNAVAELIWSRARADGSRTAVLAGGRRYSLTRLLERAEAVAGEIAERTAARPARALVRSREPLEVLAFVLGCWRVDCSAVVLHEGAPEQSVASTGRQVGATAVLEDGRWSTAASGGPAAGPPHESEVLVLTTSGTSGAPKLVALPAESVLVNTRVIAAELALDEDARLLVAQPLSRAYGLVGACLVALRSGAEIHLEPSSTPPPILQRALRERELTVVQGAPAFFQLFLEYWNGRPFPSVRVWNTGGELASPLLLAGLRAAFPGARGQVLFGMTELGPRISHFAAEDPRVPVGYIGRPFDHVAWCIEGSEGRTDATGRLRLAGPSRFLGYIGKDGAYEGVDPDGFFTSPDVVRLDPAGEGLFHCGRHDQLFKVGGHLVNPAIVEQTLLGLAGIRDARCFGEPHPILGRVVVAEIVADSGAVDEEAVLGACRRALTPPSVPRQLRYVEHTARGGAANKRTRTPAPRGVVEPGESAP